MAASFREAPRYRAMNPPLTTGRRVLPPRHAPDSARAQMQRLSGRLSAHQPVRDSVFLNADRNDRGVHLARIGYRSPDDKNRLSGTGRSKV
jgi:hypothetical protein